MGARPDAKRAGFLLNVVKNDDGRRDTVRIAVPLVVRPVAVDREPVRPLAGLEARNRLRQWLFIVQFRGADMQDCTVVVQLLDWMPEGLAAEELVKGRRDVDVRL